MSITFSTPQGSTVAGHLDNRYFSLNSFQLSPQIYGELIRTFGYDSTFGVYDLLMIAGREITFAGVEYTTFEQGPLRRTITLLDVGAGVGIAAGAAGADISFKIPTTEYDSSNRPYLQLDDTVAIPAEFQPSGVNVPRMYQIRSITGNTNDLTFTAKPFSNGTSVTKSQIAVDVPAGTVLSVRGGNYAAGAGMPGGKQHTYSSRTFKPGIIAATYGLDGSVQSTELYIDKLKNGGTGAMTRQTLLADFTMMTTKNEMFFNGEENDNTTLTQANQDGVELSVRSTKGLWNHAVERGMPQTYNKASGYTIDHLYDVKDAHRSQGVIEPDAVLFGGFKLLRDVEKSGLQHAQQFSGGASFVQVMNDYQKIGVNFKEIMVDGINFMLHELKNFSDPHGFGSGGYGFEYNGLILPYSEVTVRDSKMGSDQSMSNVVVAYKSYNGENRRNMNHVVAGVNGMGYQATHQYDNVKGYIKEECALVVLKANQLIPILAE